MAASKKKKPVPKKKPVAKKTPVAKKSAAAKKPAAKKRAATKPAAKKSTSGGILRGVALVEQALAQNPMNGEPVAADVLAAMTLGDRPLTPALRRWLQVEDLELPEPQSFAEMVATEYGDDWAEIYQEVAEVLTEPVIILEHGSDSRRFLYLGKPDSHGELPVFTIDNDDTPFVCLNGPLDVWLAQRHGLLDEERHYGWIPKQYEQARTEQAKLNFGGNVEYADGQFNKTLSG